MRGAPGELPHQVQQRDGGGPLLPAAAHLGRPLALGLQHGLLRHQLLPGLVQQVPLVLLLAGVLQLPDLHLDGGLQRGFQPPVRHEAGDQEVSHEPAARGQLGSLRLVRQQVGQSPGSLVRGRQQHRPAGLQQPLGRGLHRVQHPGVARQLYHLLLEAEQEGGAGAEAEGGEAGLVLDHRQQLQPQEVEGGGSEALLLLAGRPVSPAVQPLPHLRQQLVNQPEYALLQEH